ncbi:MAG: hypothetical protein PUE80_01490 [bacterium]|nr:hypothetical protein [bacterium]MDD6901666.1 hypothetical protein [bacterium]
MPTAIAPKAHSLYIIYSLYSLYSHYSVYILYFHYSLYSLYSHYSHFSTCRGAIFCARPSNAPTHAAPRQHPQAQFFFGEADFFSAKRLFLRAARDVSGVRSNPLWARVVIKLKMSFQVLSHSSSHARASALTSPPPDFLFSSIHPSKAHHPTKIKEHSLLVLPSMHTILNFAAEFFEMFTKLQSEPPQKVFQVFLKT